jgi:MSHA biogenesis protein MshQ
LHNLTCDVAEVEFAIKKDGQVVESVNDNFIATVNPSSDSQWCENQDGTNCFNSGHSFSFDKGIKTLYLKSSILKNNPGYEVSGKWNSDEVTSEHLIKFVPFKIDFPDAPYDVIAGQNNANLVKAQVLYCEPTAGTSSPIATDYTGSPEVQLDIQAPYDGYHNEELIGYDPEFEAGESGITIDDLAIDDSGEFFVTLTDSEFDCSELGDDCPIGGTGVLSGSFKLNSRPWTVAICDVKSLDDSRENPAKTIEKGNGSYFIPAGEPFKATFKPVIHSDYYSRNSLKVPTLCAHRAAQNYYTVDQSGKEHSAPFTITFDLEYPDSSTGASLANLEGFSETFEFSKAGGQNQPVAREESFVWNEVGSVLLKSDANYHNEDLAQSTQIIGRFYPDYFRVTGTTWTEPDNQTVFTYMSQNFKNVNFQVTAYNAATPNNQPTNNYQHFDPTLTREFDLAGAYSDRVSISTSDLSGDYWNSGAVWDASFANAQWWRLGQEQSSTIPDGPFNSSDSFGTESELKLAIVSDAGGDPAAFKMMSNELGAQDQQLLAQPHVRYGRMALADVGTSTNQVVKTPLRVEYWQGTNGFVLSSGDNASRFDVDEQCREVIWSDVSTSSAELFKLDPNETDTVSNGEATAVFARQGSDTSVNYSREQVRLFLRQGKGNPADVSCSWSDGSQDYLQYDWRQLGDEDPSTVVTFGIYRGNDRVIYRGESGLTGQ